MEASLQSSCSALKLRSDAQTVHADARLAPLHSSPEHGRVEVEKIPRGAPLPQLLDLHGGEMTISSLPSNTAHALNLNGSVHAPLHNHSPSEQLILPSGTLIANPPIPTLKKDLSH